MDEKTVNSYWPDLRELPMISPEIALNLTSLGIETPKELLAKTESEKGKKELAIKLNVSESNIAKWIHLSKLAELKRMGTLNANLLNKAGIENVTDIAKQNPAILYDKLFAIKKNDHQYRAFYIPREAIVRVWVREARSIVRDHKD